MRGSIMVLTLCLVLHASAGPSRDTERTWDDLVEELRSFERVSGWAVGGAPRPGRFFRLSKQIIDAGKEADFHKLLADERPVVRCMGLLVLAQTKGEEAIPVLKAQLADQGRIDYAPGGCFLRHITVAGFARELLHDPDHLEPPGAPPMPLLSRRELLGVDLVILARVPTIRRFDKSAAALTKAVEASKRVPGVRFFRRLCPSLAGYEIVRTFGRLRYSKAKEDFLLRCLRDETLDSQSRLAAASALTRQANDVTSRVMQEQRDALNGLDDQKPGDRLLETMTTREAYERRMAPLRDHRDWREMDQETTSKVIAAFTCDHPLALDDLLLRLKAPIVQRDPNVRRTFANSLIAIAQHISAHNQPWNTYSDSAFKMAMLLESERHAQSSRVLTEEERAEIERHLQGLGTEH